MKRKPPVPAPTQPRTKPPAVRREELLDAAERMFIKKGIALTSVDEIVLAAGVAKGTFYVHFESKEKLLFALQQRFVNRFAEGLESAMNQRPGNDWKGRLRAWVEAGISGHLDRRELHDVVFHEFRPEDPHTQHTNPSIATLSAFLERGAKAGAWPLSSTQAHVTAVMLFHAMHGALDDALEGHGEVNRKKLARTLETFFHRAIGAA